MKKVKLGVVGCGIMGKTHTAAGVNCPSATVVAVADINEAAAKNVAKQFNINKYYTDVEKILKDKEVEALIFALGSK